MLGDGIPMDDSSPNKTPKFTVTGDNKVDEQRKFYSSSKDLCEKLVDCAALTVRNHDDQCLTSLLSQEPWPDDVQLFQPYKMEQILLPDNANCLAVETFLKMCDLKYDVELRTNTEEMSPSGRVPFIKCGECLISDFEPISTFVLNKGISLSAHLDEPQKTDMKAFMSLVNTVLGNAENYITWVDEETYKNVTKPRYGSVHPFPLNHVLCYLKRKRVIKKLAALGWANKTLDKVYEEVNKGLEALSDRLGKSKFFFGDQPCEVDAIIFGHVYAILTLHSMPAGVGLAEMLRKYQPIVNHCKSMMPVAELGGDIDTPMYHRCCPREQSASEITDEFSCLFDDDDDSEYPYSQNIQDYSCLLNGKNTIHDAVLGDHDTEIDTDFKEEIYQS